MFDNTLVITRNENKVNSYGRILSKACIRVKIATLICGAFGSSLTDQQIIRGDKTGYEQFKKTMRFSVRLSDLVEFSKVRLTDYAELIDSLGNRHEYKILGLDTRTILGCTWGLVYLENISARDISEIQFEKSKTLAIP